MGPTGAPGLLRRGQLYHGDGLRYKKNGRVGRAGRRLALPGHGPCEKQV